MNSKNHETELFGELDIEGRTFDSEHEAVVELAKRAEWCTGD